MNRMLCEYYLHNVWFQVVNKFENENEEDPPEAKAQNFEGILKLMQQVMWLKRKII